MAMLIRSILFVKDAELMSSFYQAALGLNVICHEPGWIVLSNGGVELALHGIPAEIASTIIIENPPVSRSETPIKLVFAAKDLEAAAAAIENAGGWIERRFEERFDAKDPEGNIFQVAV
jgi:predicted enzyme related to lactoylglutathione lyase